MGEIAEAVATRDRRTALVAMADKLAADMDEAPPAVVAQVAGRLQAVLAEIAGLPQPGKVTKLDELEQRRREKDGGAASGGDAPAIRPKRQSRR